MKAENIVIEDFSPFTIEAMKYWSQPRATNPKKKKEEAKAMCLSGQYYGARKYDGFWGMIIKDSDGEFHLRSRTESTNGGYLDKAEWVPHICEALSPIPNNTVLLGEIFFPNNEGSRKVTTVLNCLKDKCIARQEKGEKLCFYIFDMLAYNGHSFMKMPFKQRIDNVANLANIIKSPYIYLADYKCGEDLWNLWGEVISSGGEGIVITRENSLYSPGKRTARMTLKMKKELIDPIDAFLDGDYKPAKKAYEGDYITSWSFWLNSRTGEKVNKCMINEYTNGEPWEPISKAYYYGWASAVSFSVMKDGVPTHIAWISGITDELKRDIVEKNEELRCKVAELGAMQIENINGEYSLRHGYIIQWRDKSYLDCDFSQIADRT